MGSKGLLPALHVVQRVSPNRWRKNPTSEGTDGWCIELDDRHKKKSFSLNVGNKWTLWVRQKPPLQFNRIQPFRQDCTWCIIVSNKIPSRWRFVTAAGAFISFLFFSNRHFWQNSFCPTTTENKEFQQHNRNCSAHLLVSSYPFQSDHLFSACQPTSTLR